MVSDYPRSWAYADLQLHCRSLRDLKGRVGVKDKCIAALHIFEYTPHKLWGHC